MRLISWFSIWVLAVGGLALSQKDSILFTCILQAVNLEFDYTVPDGKSSFWNPFCEYEPALGTVLICFHELTSNRTSGEAALQTTLSLLVDNCSKRGNFKLDESELHERYLNASRLAIPEEKFMKKNATLPIHNPVRLNVTSLLLYADSYTLFAKNFVWTNNFCQLVCLFWIVSLGLVGLFNFFKRFRWNSKLKGPFINKFRGYIALPTFTGGKHFQPWNIFGSLGKWLPFSLLDCLVPTTQESLIVFIYCTLNIIFASVGYHIEDQNLLLGSRDEQFWRYVADRTGILAFAQLPALFLFGGRNNILINLTGFQFNSFIIFHKWISRNMVILAAVHAYAYRELCILHGSYDRISQETLWIYGRRAFVAGGLLILQAIYYFRSRWYELFLAVHILLALVFIVGAYVHCKEIGYLEWTYASMLFWALDRVWRIGKMYRFGLPKAHFKLHFETIVVTIPKPANWKPYPGCFVYLYIIAPSVSWKVWESHPFTIYSVGDEIRIYIKRKDGMTQKLYDFLTVAGESELTVSVEGPYGHAGELDSYDNILLLAGGNGVPGPYYHCMHQLDQAPLNRWKRKIHFVWISPYFTALRWFGRELLDLQTKDKHNFVSKSIYLTREKQLTKRPANESGEADSRTPLISISSEELMARVMGQLSEEHLADYVVHKRRPDVAKLIMSTIEEATFEGNHNGIAIVVCGSDILADSIRDVVAGIVANGSHTMRIDLFEELQVW
ncbi:hypothetical protein OGAPHI_005680 [Ogataea philodendri]|uniref:FAD-binding FR-type domain-containing protein n=1 Tax=Ogataea philodendri TaxID=1378263 RepID=A0A9P8NYV0_9ASCO|nr:uncharacterized protein OGAPHI_005680 [Ogataea philodendri]KAH3662428.1 hypothetical protein OGAPHI_005680 [Ogataea philodendri]